MVSGETIRRLVQPALLRSSILLCRYGHHHPPFAVAVPEQPEGGRVHCFKCPHVSNRRTHDSNWVACTAEKEVRAALQNGALCRDCFAGVR